MQTTSAARPQIVIVGAGFGGLQTAKGLANKPVDVLVIDRNNYHTFTPLLYQVGTAGLDPGEIAAPIRGVFHGIKNIWFELGEVTHIDPDQQIVHVQLDSQQHDCRYDYLVLSPGSVTNFFGLKDVGSRAFGLKSLTEAIALRNHVLLMFERAAAERDPKVRVELMTVVVIGGGPTGLELSGALSELVWIVLAKDYPNLDVSQARIILIEATDHLLAQFPAPLEKSAGNQIRKKGVEVMLKKRVVKATDQAVILEDGTTIPTHTIIWTAGVEAEEVSGLKVEEPKAHRMRVLPTLQLPDYPDIYVIGDAAYLPDGKGSAYPQLAPVAMQMGRLAAANILATKEGKPLRAFQYHDRGIMATIGRSAAVAWVFNKIQLSGFIAWIAWLVLHLIYLVGFRNRTIVLINWAWNWWTWERGVRIIVRR